MDSGDARVYGDQVLFVEPQSGDLIRTGRDTFPDFSNDLKAILDAEREDFIHP